MDRGAWRPIVRGVIRIRRYLVTKYHHHHKTLGVLLLCHSDHLSKLLKLTIYINIYHH